MVVGEREKLIKRLVSHFALPHHAAAPHADHFIRSLPFATAAAAAVCCLVPPSAAFLANSRPVRSNTMSGTWSVFLGLALVCQLVITATIRPDCVERSLCYHSTDCCSTTGEQCADANVARNCSTLTCPADQECEHEMRFCLIAPCPQPLPKCVRKKTQQQENDVPLPVQYNN
ncbi:hypothetical protein B566_EDAN010671 [Ephemera danica]|nr:hypothetical protein B566_EDAN010671 [Ephemera danica]